MRLTRVTTYDGFKSVCNRLGVSYLWRGKQGYIYDREAFKPKNNVDNQGVGFNEF